MKDMRERTSLPPTAPADPTPVHRTGRVAPGPFRRGLRGVLPELTADPLGFLGEMWRLHGDVVRLPLGRPPLGRIGHLVVHPDDVQRILVERQREYELSSAYDVLRSVLGEGLLTSHGDDWRLRRRRLQPAFSPARLAGVAPLVCAAAEDGCHSLAERVGPVRLYDEMARITLDVVGRALLGVEVRDTASVIAPALRVAQDFAINAIYSPWSPLLGSGVRHLPTPAAHRFRRAIAGLHVVVDELIERRRSSVEPGDDDVLALLLGSTAGDTDADILRDELTTFLLAGHETTASALTWTLVSLASSPEVRRDVQDELDSILGGRAAEYADLDRLPLLSAVVSESLRLNPPAWMLERRASADDVIGGYDLPAGSAVILGTYWTHRHPEFWNAPDRFDPGRWLGAVAADRHRAAYVPFGAGPRQCIGGAFSLIEAKLVLAALLQRFDIDPVPGADIRPQPRITLTASASLEAVIRPRR
jgi:cytochrome P450